MKTAESYNASITMNTDMSLEYAEKKRNAAYVQHSVMMIEYIAFEIYQWDTDASIATEIIQYESQNATRKKNM